MCIHALTFLTVVLIWSREFNLVINSTYVFKIVNCIYYGEMKLVSYFGKFSFSYFSVFFFFLHISSYRIDFLRGTVTLMIISHGMLISHFCINSHPPKPSQTPPPSSLWPSCLCLLACFFFFIQPPSPDMLRCGEELYSFSILISACSFIHRKLLEIWRWWSNKSSNSAL